MTCISQNRGYILLPVVILLTLVSAAAFMLDYESALDSGISASALEARQAEVLAQAGIGHATWALQNSGCVGDMVMTAVAFGAGNYSANLDSAATSTSSFKLNPDQDAFIRENNPDTAFGSDSGLETGVQRRSLMHFDLSTIPAGSRVVNATLWLYVTTNDPVDAINIHPLTAAWTEADATWNTMASRYSAEVFGVIAPQPVANAWVSVNLTAMAQSWLNDAALNHGLMLVSGSLTIETRFSSRDHGSGPQHPFLQITTADGDVSPVQISATGTLTGNPGPADDITRTLTRTDNPVYQLSNSFFVQPDAADGKDAWLTADKTTWNYGKFAWLRVRAGGGGHWRSPIRFELGSLPYGAHIHSAALDLYRISGTQDAPGQINVHAISRDWEEGDSSGGTNPGVTWDNRDTALPWNTPGGDLAPEPSASVVIDTNSDTWFSVDVSSLVQQWVNGDRDNHGMMLVAGDNGVLAEFASSDHADPTLHPKLSIRYACECGSPCLAPQGSGTVLMVVVNPTALVPDDAYKRALFESWGYTVTVVGESDNQASYDAAIAAADVVFISETVNAIQVGTKLQDVAIGVVSQDGTYNDALGIALGSDWPVASAINVIDTSHYISAVFPPGPLQIYSKPMEQLTVSGSGAADLQTLADTGGAGSLVVLDTGAIGTGGTSLAARRVMLPLGRDANFNWDYLNASGRLLLHRALQWGMGAELGAPPPQLLFVSGGSLDTVVTPTAQEQLRIDLIEAWGYSVTLIHASQSQADFDTALADSDVAYVSSAVTEVDLGTKLKDATIGVVNEQGALVDEFGFGLQNVNYKSRHEIDVVDNTHYITEPFATGLLTIVSSDQMLHIITANKGAGFTALAQVFNTGSLWDDAMGTIDTGGELFGGGNAAGRRVLLPWGEPGFDLTSLNADGQTIMQRAIEWAEGKGSSPAPAYNVLLVVAEAGNLSSADADRKAVIEGWGHTVTLIDDSDSQANFDAASATVDVAYIAESVILMELAKKLKAATIGVVNEDPALHDVFGFSTSRFLSSGNPTMATDAAHYITSPFGGSEVTLFASSQPLGAAVGTLPSGLDIIGSWSGGTMSSLGGLLALDAGASITGGGTAAGRRVQLPWGGQDGVSVADINALTADGLTVLQRSLMWAAGAGSGGGSGGSGASCAGTVADNFESDDYSGSSGTLPWSTDWLEVNESDGPGGGDVKVASHAGDLAALLKDNGFGNSGEGLERESDLAGYASATLTYSYWRNLGNNDSVAVQVSSDGGANWIELDLYAGPATDADADPQSANYDITAYISPDTRIRFMTGTSNGNNDGMYIDDIQICVTD